MISHGWVGHNCCRFELIRTIPSSRMERADCDPA
jgi:hypothetical protein